MTLWPDRGKKASHPANNRPVLRILGPVMTAFNFLGLLTWLYTSRLRPVTPGGQPLTGLDAISLEIAVLTLVVAAVALGLAFAAIIGYNAFKDMVMERASKLIQEHLNTVQLGDAERNAVATLPSTSIVGDAEKEENEL